LEAGLKPRRWPKTRVAAAAGAALVALALVLALARPSGSDWSSQQRNGVQVLVQSGLSQATKDQQVCVVDYVTGHFSPEDWAAMVRRYAELNLTMGDAILTEANASGCASK
jgi:hypothetical protein